METLENVSFKDIDEQFVLDAEEYKTLVKDLSILEKLNRLHLIGQIL
ncbi:hypothetical protein [Staphylococcus aureus]|nr:hypothetical protein [Staphylococcus aureus]MCQ1327714.1 hypothetical protein [Staphylococcus aureus]